MLLFGIDWSQDHHNLCIRNEAGAILTEIKFEHSLKGFACVEAERLKFGVPASECLVAIETAQNLLVDYLLDCGYQVYVIPPQSTEGYRSRHRSSGAHTDETDAALLADALRTDREHLRRLQPNGALTQQLLAQIRLIETLRRSIQRQENQLRSALLRAYPMAVDLFSDLTTQISLEFLMAYPTAKQAEALSLQQFDAFCCGQGYKRSDLVAQRYAHLIEPMPAASPAVVQAYESHVRVLAQVLLPQVQHRRAALADLQRLFQQHPDAAVFASLPGAGDLLAPALLAKFGDDRNRFPEPGHVQALAGTCPVTKRSGKVKYVEFRQGCDKEFRRIAQQFARASVTKSGWAAAYWRELRPRCDSDSHAYRVLANRWLAIIWKLWQTRTLYDEGHHLQQRALRRRPKP